MLLAHKNNPRHTRERGLTLNKPLSINQSINMKGVCNIAQILVGERGLEPPRV